MSDIDESDVESVHKECNEKIVNLKNVIKKLKKEVQELKELKEEADEEINDLQEYILKNKNVWKSKIKEKKEEINELHRKLEQIKYKKPNDRKNIPRIEELEAELESYKEENSNLKKESKNLIKNNTKLKNDIKEQNDGIEELENKIKHLKTEICQLKKNIREKEENYFNNENLEDENTKQKRNFEKELHKKDEELKKKQDAIDRMKRKIENLNSEERTTIKNGKEDELTEWKNETQRLKEVLNVKDKAIQAIKVKLNEVEKEKYEFNGEIVRMSAEMEECKRDLMKEKQNYNKLSNEFENRKLYYDNKIKNLEQEIQQIRVKKFRNPNENAPNNDGSKFFYEKIRVKEFRNAPEKAPNKYGSKFDNKQNDDLPEWWDNHRENRNNRRPQLVKCYNCREGIPITEIARHARMCDQHFDEDWD